MNRVYRPISEWEETRFNMWGEVANVKDMLRQAITFTGDHVAYGSFMKRVINEWPASCENALTDVKSNRKAWLGHAACALAIGCPEDITRKAWGHLSDEQQNAANAEAERYIAEWERDYRNSRGLHKQMGDPMLPS